jgi:hypothetical protein
LTGFGFPNVASESGLPDFSLYNIPKWGKIYQIATKLSNGHKIYQMAVNIPNDHRHNIPTFFIPRPSQIYPNFDFWFENIPSGNLDLNTYSKAPTLFRGGWSFVALATLDFIKISGESTAARWYGYFQTKYSILGKFGRARGMEHVAVFYGLLV